MHLFQYPKGEHAHPAVRAGFQWVCTYRLHSCGQDLPDMEQITFKVSLKCARVPTPEDRSHHPSVPKSCCAQTSDQAGRLSVLAMRLGGFTAGH